MQRLLTAKCSQQLCLKRNGQLQLASFTKVFLCIQNPKTHYQRLQYYSSSPIVLVKQNPGIFLGRKPPKEEMVSKKGRSSPNTAAFRETLANKKEDVKATMIALQKMKSAATSPSNLLLKLQDYVNKIKSDEKFILTEETRNQIIQQYIKEYRTIPLEDTYTLIYSLAKLKVPFGSLPQHLHAHLFHQLEEVIPELTVVELGKLCTSFGRMKLTKEDLPANLWLQIEFTAIQHLEAILLQSAHPSSSAAAVAEVGEVMINPWDISYLLHGFHHLSFQYFDLSIPLQQLLFPRFFTAQLPHLQATIITSNKLSAVAVVGRRDRSDSEIISNLHGYGKLGLTYDHLVSATATNNQTILVDKIHSLFTYIHQQEQLDKANKKQTISYILYMLRTIEMPAIALQEETLQLLQEELIALYGMNKQQQQQVDTVLPRFERSSSTMMSSSSAAPSRLLSHDDIDTELGNTVYSWTMINFPQQAVTTNKPAQPATKNNTSSTIITTKEIKIAEIHDLFFQAIRQQMHSRQQPQSSSSDSSSSSSSNRRGEGIEAAISQQVTFLLYLRAIYFQPSFSFASIIHRIKKNQQYQHQLTALTLASLPATSTVSKVKLGEEDGLPEVSFAAKLKAALAANKFAQQIALQSPDRKQPLAVNEPDIDDLAAEQAIAAMASSLSAAASTATTGQHQQRQQLAMSTLEQMDQQLQSQLQQADSNGQHHNANHNSFSSLVHYTYRPLVTLLKSIRSSSSPSTPAAHDTAYGTATRVTSNWQQQQQQAQQQQQPSSFSHRIISHYLIVYMNAALGYGAFSMINEYPGLPAAVPLYPMDCALFYKASRDQLTVQANSSKRGAALLPIVAYIEIDGIYHYKYPFCHTAAAEVATSSDDAESAPTSAIQPDPWAIQPTHALKRYLYRALANNYHYYSQLPQQPQPQQSPTATVEQQQQQQSIPIFSTKFPLDSSKLSALKKEAKRLSKLILHQLQANGTIPSATAAAIADNEDSRQDSNKKKLQIKQRQPRFVNVPNLDGDADAAKNKNKKNKKNKAGNWQQPPLDSKNTAKAKGKKDGSIHSVEDLLDDDDYDQLGDYQREEGDDEEDELEMISIDNQEYEEGGTKGTGKVTGRGGGGGGRTGGRRRAVMTKRIVRRSRTRSSIK